MPQTYDVPNLFDIVHFVTFMADGRIHSIGSCPAVTLENQFVSPGATMGFAEISQAQVKTHYMLDPYTAAPRPSFELPADFTILADGEDEAVFGPLPEGTLVTIDGEPAELNVNLELRLTSDMPATYALTFSAWPYLDHTINLEVIDAAA